MNHLIKDEIFPEETSNYETFEDSVPYIFMTLITHLSVLTHRSSRNEIFPFFKDKEGATGTYVTAIEYEGEEVEVEEGKDFYTFYVTKNPI
jgi:hypothetical protein